MINHNTIQKRTSLDIYLLIPNLVGYFRGLLIIVAFCICFTHPYWFIVLYGMSQLLDGLDGYIARRMNQVSLYGAMLDMVLDRVSTTALLVILSRFYPAYTRWIIVIMLLDVVSHFTHVYSSLLYGKRTHKAISYNQHWILKLYYNHKSILSTLCIGSEVYLLYLYIQHFEVHSSFIFCLQPFVRSLVYYLLGMLFIFKQITNIVQLLQAIKDIVKLDSEA
jgi:CDP-diacylglycerol--inositol 3-phosphatidyltransferase